MQSKPITTPILATNSPKGNHCQHKKQCRDQITRTDWSAETAPLRCVIANQCYRSAIPTNPSCKNRTMYTSPSSKTANWFYLNSSADTKPNRVSYVELRRARQLRTNCAGSPSRRLFCSIRVRKKITARIKQRARARACWWVRPTTPSLPNQA